MTSRWFVGNVVTGTLAFEGNGVIKEYAGGYSDWVRQRPASMASATAGGSQRPGKSSRAVSKPASAVSLKSEKKRKLTYSEQHELKSLPDRIEKLEAERDQLYVELSNPDVLRDGALATQKNAAVERLEVEILELMERWELLEGIVEG